MDSAQDDFPASTNLIMYGHRTCPMVPPVWTMLQQSKVEFDYIDIHKAENLNGRTHVRAINNGNESVPTLVFPDGSTLTEPSPMVLHRKLMALGYQVPLHARIGATVMAYIPMLIVGVVMIIAVLQFLEVI